MYFVLWLLFSILLLILIHTFIYIFLFPSSSFFLFLFVFIIFSFEFIARWYLFCCHFTISHAHKYISISRSLASEWDASHMNHSSTHTRAPACTMHNTLFKQNRFQIKFFHPKIKIKRNEWVERKKTVIQVEWKPSNSGGDGRNSTTTTARYFLGRQLAHVLVGAHVDFPIQKTKTKPRKMLSISVFYFTFSAVRCERNIGISE